MRRNIDESIKVAATLQQHYRTAVGSPYAGTGVDTLDFEDILVVYNAGTHVATGTCDIHLEDSDDNTTFADVTGAVFAQVTTANDETTYLASVRPGSTRRYLRAYAVIATADCNGGVFFLANSRVPAVTQDFASTFTIT